MTKSCKIVRNRCEPVCGYRAGYLVLGLAPLEVQIWFEIKDFRLDPLKFFGALLAQPRFRYTVFFVGWVWFGLVWFGLVWFGLGWFGLV